MAIGLKINIGKCQIQVTGKTEEDVIEQISFFAELPTCCGLCQSKNIGFRHRKTKGQGKVYDFYELRCNDCRGTYALGQKMEGGLYPRGSQEKGHEGEWEVEYKGGGQRGDDRRDDDRGGRDDRNDRRGGDGRSERNQDRGNDRGGDRDRILGGGGQQEQQRHRGGSGGGRQPDPMDDDDIPF